MTVLKMYDGEKYIPCYTAPKGTTEQIGDVQLTNERSTDESKAATPKAVQAGLSPLEFKFSGATSDKETGYFTQESKDGVVNGWTYNGAIPLANIPQLTLDKIPQSAQERLYVAKNKDEMYKLTTENVQVGDTVKDNNTGLLYYVKKNQDGKITSGNFTEYYEVYTAGKATEADHATKATNDGDGHNIVDTYATKSSIGKAMININQTSNTDGKNPDGKTDITYAKNSFSANQSGDAVTINLTDTTYNDVTQSTHGLMTASDKKKLDGIASSANNYTLPTASASTLGGVKIGSNLSIEDGVLSGTPDTDTTYTLRKENSTIKLVNSAGITVGSVPDSNTTYSTATSSSSGLMSSTDKTAFDFIKKGYYTFAGDGERTGTAKSVGKGGNFICSLHGLPQGSYFIIGSASLQDVKPAGGGFHVGLSYYYTDGYSISDGTATGKSNVKGISSALSPLTTDANQTYNGYTSACAVGFITLKGGTDSKGNYSSNIGHIVLSGNTGEDYSGNVLFNLPFNLQIGNDIKTLGGPGGFLIAIPITL